jgi:hypothetical protein
MLGMWFDRLLIGGSGYILFQMAVFFFFDLCVVDYDWFFIGGSGYFVFRLGR